MSMVEQVLSKKFMYFREKVAYSNLATELKADDNDDLKELVDAYNNILEVYIEYPVLSYKVYDRVADHLWATTKKLVEEINLTV